MIEALLTSILQNTHHETLSTQAAGNKKNRKIPSGIIKAGVGAVGGVGRSVENLSSGTKVKKSSRADFFSTGTKEIFIHLRKAFTKALIQKYFDPERHIQIEIYASWYAIGEVLSQMTLDQHSFNHMTHKANDETNPLSKIGQWHPVAFFSQKMILTETQYNTQN